MAIIRPLLGRLTQGCIFNCARADRYQGKEVFGFVITARCDIEQSKFPILNYLPVVKLDDWLSEDGLEILSSRLLSEYEGSIKKILKDCEIAESIFYSQSMTSILANFFSYPHYNNKCKTTEARFRNLVDNIELINLSKNAAIPSAKAVFSLNEKVSSVLIKELVHQKLSGYYFIPSVYDSGDYGGYVIILREVRNLARGLALRVARGLEEAEAAEIASHSSLSFIHDTFAMPIGELSSPAVEHVLQTFSALFARIGLDDPPQKYVDEICGRRPGS